MTAKIIPFPIEAQHGPQRYVCHCNALTRQDCYCWDRRPSKARPWIMSGILMFCLGSWAAVLRLIFRVLTFK